LVFKGILFLLSAFPPERLLNFLFAKIRDAGSSSIRPRELPEGIIGSVSEDFITETGQSA
jgi:hypothetical protein